MSDLDRIVSSTIVSSGPAVTQVGFGTPLILGTAAWQIPTVAEYTSTDDMVTAGCAVTNPEYLAAAVMFAQSPRPPTVKVAKRATPPTMVVTVSVPAPAGANGGVYKVTVTDGAYSKTYSYPAGANASAAMIAAGIEGLIAADVGNLPHVTAAYVTNATSFTLTAAAAGDWFDVSVDVTVLKVAQTNTATDSANVQSDLNAILLVDSDWYAFVSTFHGDTTIEGCATWGGSNSKLLAAVTQDTDVINTTVAADNSTVAYVLKGASDKYVTLMYHPDPGAFADAALLGRCLPYLPGSETWKFKTLTGVPAVAMTPTQETNALNKNVMIYHFVGGIAITEEGVVSDGEFIDNIRFQDWLKAQFQQNIFQFLADSPKVPFDDTGISAIQSIVMAVLKQGVSVGGLAATPVPVVTVPKAADVPLADRQVRKLSGIKWSATLASAVHSAELQGTISI